MAKIIQFKPKTRLQEILAKLRRKFPDMPLDILQAQAECEFNQEANKYRPK